jgi:hypothetical protein
MEVTVVASQHVKIAVQNCVWAVVYFVIFLSVNDVLNF